VKPRGHDTTSTRHGFARAGRRGICAGLALAIAGFASAQSATAWPSKPVTIVVALAPGAATDIETRMYAQKMSESIGRPVVVEYRPGAGSTIGTHYVVKSPPDGHTLIVMAPTFTFSNLSYPNLPYDPLKDIAPVSLMSRRPSIVLVHPSLPVKSVTELIALAKKYPGKLNVGTAGAGSFAELGWQWFGAITGIKFTIVNYKGGAPASAALMAGEVQVALGGITQMMPQVKAGKVRLIGVTTAERSKALPDVPTMAEQGAPGFAYEQWIGMGVTGATPAPLVERLNAELVKAAKHPDVIARLADDGTIIVASSPDEFRQRIAAEAARWRKVAEATGAKLAQ
jgi:tripartite-type tricarboxylate transporter receptor subunit TctC